jgi:hypothetical protein
MQTAAEASERLVCAVLAAQVAVIRDRVDTGDGIDLLWRTGDVLARLSHLVIELGRRCPAPDPELNEQCAAAVAAEAEVSSALDALAFLQSQRHDLARQLADCVVTALARLAIEDTSPAGMRLSPEDLEALYVCDAQRETHEAVTQRFEIDAAHLVQELGIGRRGAAT